MTATTWAIGGWIFPRDLPKVTPEIARNLISQANAVHVLALAFSEIFVGMALVTVYANFLIQRSLEEVKKDSGGDSSNTSLENSVIRQEKHHYISTIPTNIAAVCMLILAGVFATAGYKSWRDYHAVAFPELQRIAG